MARNWRRLEREKRQAGADRAASGLAACESLDGMAPLRNGLRRLAGERGEWAGMPMPLDGQRLVVEPSYPYAKGLMEIGRTDDAHAQIKVRNEFHSQHRRADVIIWEDGGKVEWGIIPAVHGVAQMLDTLGASDAWGIEQEGRAVDLLGKLIRHRQLKQYLLTGMFMEQSARSGVHYVFRRLRPTIAIRTTEKSSRILAALCLHPIAYYAGSWAGAMCPTDDVIAHLMLMRGDEPMFWRRANQHAPWRPEAGL